jgi:hypothetical protein
LPSILLKHPGEFGARAVSSHESLADEESVDTVATHQIDIARG